MIKNLNKEKLFSVFKNKKIIFGVLIVVVLLFIFLKNGNNTNFSIVNQNFGELKETVKATGKVVSSTELSLSFDKSGRARSVNVKVGDKVRAGQVLISLDAQNDYSRLLEARASLASSNARLAKVLEGATNEEINLANVLYENALRDYENTKITQNLLVENAYKKLLNSSFEAKLENSSSFVVAPVISGTYNLKEEGQILISVYNTGNGLTFSASGLLSDIKTITPNISQSLSNSGLFINFSSISGLEGTKWIIEIPNKKSVDYLNNKNAYENALRNRESSISSGMSLVNQRRAELDLKRASARNADIELAEADILVAKARVKDAEINYDKNVLLSPTSGTVTRVEIKPGELAQAQKEVIVIEDINNLYVEANINESNITKINLGQEVEIIFDALSKEEVFLGKVASIEPSALSNGGVVNYKTKILLSKADSRIKPGMNADISVLIFKKENVLSIPSASIFEKEGKKFVSVLIDEKNKIIEDKVIEIGTIGDGSMIEVLSGIKENDILVIKK